jgi:hypothetical protein
VRQPEPHQKPGKHPDYTVALEATRRYATPLSDASKPIDANKATLSLSRRGWHYLEGAGTTSKGLD